MKSSIERIPRSIVLSYSIGSLGTGIYLTVPSVLLLYYLTEILNVSPGLAGIAVFIPRVWDMITDPLMGWVSDRTKSRIGRRRPYLLVGAVLTSMSFVFLFSAPELSTPLANFTYVLVVYVLSATAYTIFAVPYISMPAEMSSHEDERASIMAYRMTFAMAGVMAGSAAAPALLEYFGGGRFGFSAMSWVLGGFCAFTMLIAFFGTARAPVVAIDNPDQKRGAKLFDALRDPDFRNLSMAYIFQLAGLAVFNACIPYFVVDITGRSEGAISTVFLALLGSTLVSLFLWLGITRVVGKFNSYIVSALIAALGFGSMWLITGPDQWNLVLVSTAIVGFGFGGLQLLPFAILTDIIHQVRQGGRDSAGAFTGVWTAVEKGGLAVGPLIVGAFLSVGGFVSASEVQTEEALIWVRLTVAVVPAVLSLASVPLVIRFGAFLKKSTA